MCWFAHKSLSKIIETVMCVMICGLGFVAVVVEESLLQLPQTVKLMTENQHEDSVLWS
jgi:hypothetical protein